MHLEDMLHNLCFFFPQSAVCLIILSCLFMFFINHAQKFKYQPGHIKVSDMYSTTKYVAKPVSELCLDCNLVYHDTISFVLCHQLLQGTWCLHRHFLPEGGGSMFLCSVGNHLQTIFCHNQESHENIKSCVLIGRE